MGIRSTVRAIIIRDGKILLNRYDDDRLGGEHFLLPGGGQEQYETMHEAVVRECLEETGYTVKPARFATVCEVISTDEDYRKNFPNRTHRIHHIFICELLNIERATPTEQDETQVGIEWVDINSLAAKDSVPLFPVEVRDNLQDILNGTASAFLGSRHQRY
ncbi:MAG: NUDIX domain-containing protein [Defluviitaleaceae bacterium]|nr:NUDIX domain-containing protein [Defluviitaleaceae bacterium]